MITPTLVRVREERLWRSMEEFDRHADYLGMVQPSQPLVAPCVKRIKWRLIWRGLGMMAGFLGSHPGVEVTREGGELSELGSKSLIRF